ncbi:transposase family protein [Clostridium gasigenes]|uniref:transposase family protein n=1 Tax=Clostridium gasigenes TaxID=94869 RepID=UPI001C0D7C22|nr:transposase family protein [Clostridium gasigenes]
MIENFISIIKLINKIEDPRQKKKVKYLINEVVGMFLFASLENANEWTAIELFCEYYEACLKLYFHLKNGIPSHKFSRLFFNT